MSGNTMNINKELALVEGAIRTALRSNVDILGEMADIVIRSGGKRLRPQVVILSYLAVGGKETERVVDLATAVELAHVATLIHDDIIDRSEMRRGQATINSQWGDNLSLLMGDFIFAKLMQLMATTEPQAIRVMADCCVSLVEGESRQTSSIWDTRMTEETYLEIVAKKTGALFAASAELGAMSGRSTARQVAALRDYGLKFGLAFQIRDDTLDLVGKIDELGKPVASDLSQGKLTLPIIFALRKSKLPIEALQSSSVDAIKELLCDTGSIDYAIMRAAEYCKEAKAALSVLPSSEAKAALCTLVDFALDRDK
jgi:octaprenyl-diphosphate synthase